MSDKKRHLSLRIDDKILKKLHYVCNYNGRSANKQIIFYIKNDIRAFEKENGEINLEE